MSGMRIHICYAGVDSDILGSAFLPSFGEGSEGEESLARDVSVKGPIRTSQELGGHSSRALLRAKGSERSWTGLMRAIVARIIMR